MKQLLILLVIVLPLFATAQPDSTQILQEKAVIKELLLTKVVKEKRLDSLKGLKLKELKKQHSLLMKVQFAIKELFKKQPEIKPLDQSKISIPTLAAIKPDSESVFCEACYFEEKERTFFGKIFNNSKFRIRTYKYENDKKVYLD